MQINVNSSCESVSSACSAFTQLWSDVNTTNCQCLSVCSGSRLTPRAQKKQQDGSVLLLCVWGRSPLLLLCGDHTRRTGLHIVMKRMCLCRNTHKYAVTALRQKEEAVWKCILSCLGLMWNMKATLKPTDEEPRPASQQAEISTAAALDRFWVFLCIFFSFFL